jgi:hypothetical protein
MTNKPLEKSIENILRQAVEDEGGLCLKWVCPGHKGVPDRMLLFPGGIIAFVELKRPGAKVKAGGLQNWWRQRLAEFGFPCHEVNDKYQAQQLVADLSAESFRRQTEEEEEEAMKAWHFIGDHSEGPDDEESDD